MTFKKPPRGYRMMEHPLPHNFFYAFDLDFMDATKDATILPLFRTDTTAIAADQIICNPTNAGFAEDTGPTILNGSIIPKVMVSAKFNLSQATIADNEFGSVVVNVMPLYMAFLDTYEAKNAGPPSTEVEAIIEMQAISTGKKGVPLYSGIDLTAGTLPMSTITNGDVFGDWKLSVDTKLESVAFTQNDYYDALQYFSIAGMIRKVSGRKRSFVLSRDRTAHMFSDNFTSPSVKRGNHYTFCGLLVWVNIPGTAGSYGAAGDWNGADLDIIHGNVQVRYDEWNVDFDQTAY